MFKGTLNQTSVNPLDILRWDELDLTIEARLLEVQAVLDPNAELDYEEEEEAVADTGEAAVAEVVEAEGAVAAVDPAPAP